ncbi:MAG: restriction endonuclease subunit S [Burkholderiales bacterium]|nr:restriction endonuclease subunit S [Burkholderiales bacterium]
MKHPTYDAYRPSPFSWMDRVPKHWDSAALRWVSKRYAGGTPDKGNDAYWEDGTIPWLNSGAVNDGYITAPSELITPEGLANSSAKWIPKGALVMALAGQGKTKGMVAQLGIATTCNQSMAAIIPARRLDSRYLYWWLTANYQNIRNLAGGEARDGLNLDLLGSIPCPIPPLAEQQAIVRFVDAKSAQIDVLVAQKRLLIDKLKEKRQALIARTVTRGLPPEEARRSGLDPHPRLRPLAEAWVDAIPTHWDVWKITHGFETIGSGTTPPSDNEDWYDGDVPWVTTGELRESRITSTAKRVSDAAIREFSALKVFPQDSILIAMYGATIGRLGILGISATTNQACCALANGIAFDVGFLFFWFQAFREQLVMLATGGGQTNISQEKIRSLRIPCPDLPEQELICGYLSRETGRLDHLVEVAEDAIDRLQKLRLSITNSAVIGKIDVRDFR